MDCAHGICRPTSAHKEQTETRNLQKNIQNIEKLAIYVAFGEKSVKLLFFITILTEKEKFEFRACNVVVRSGIL